MTADMPTVVTSPPVEPPVEPPGEPRPFTEPRGWRRHWLAARAWLERQPMWLFTLIMAVLGLVSRYALVPVVHFLHTAGGLSLATLEGPPIFTASDSAAHVLFMVLAVAPLLESALNQSLVIGLLALLTNRTWVQITVSTLIFALMHWPKPAQMIMAITPGLALGYVYVFWRGRGKHSSYWAAVLTHFWTNGIATLMGVALGLGIRQ